MVQDLIYDIGMHKGEDTLYYLKKGYRVVAVEANPELVNKAVELFKEYIESGKLIIINVGVADKDGSLTFYRNDYELEWSSFDKVIGTRDYTPFTEMQIPCRTAASIFAEYGVPHYLKIDIEGYDAICINGIETSNAPLYVSCEASSLDCLDALVQKGYTQFKLINQARNFTAFDIELEKNTLNCFMQMKWNRLKMKLQKWILFKYQMGSSGPFGEDTPGPWVDAAYIRHAYNQFYSASNNQPINGLSWFDIHAKK
ncbi:MAG: FkbM family methyltransferase [Sediminibacterium sp.]|nr:FkbM family methyltransferase [Sediminibacterium sp.]